MGGQKVGGGACLQRRSGHRKRGSGQSLQRRRALGVFFPSIYGLMLILLSEKSNLITSAEPLWQRFMQREGGGGINNRGHVGVCGEGGGGMDTRSS